MADRKKPKSEASKLYKGQKKHPVEQIFEMRWAFKQEIAGLKRSFEEDINCIGAFFRGTQEKATVKGLPHEYFKGEGPRFAHAYYRLFFSNPELFPGQKDHPSDFDAWSTYETLTNANFDPDDNPGLLELVNLRTALEHYEYKGRSINAIIREAEETGSYKNLEEAMNQMVAQYYEATKKESDA